MSPRLSDADRISRAIDDRRFDVAGVRAALDELSLEELTDLLGPGREQITYSSPAFGRKRDGTFGVLWAQGDGRPKLARDDVAAMQALGRCVASRLRSRIVDVPMLADGAIHPAPCGWCSSDLDDALEAIAWATYRSRHVVDRLLIFSGLEGSWYARSLSSGYYESPAWAVWFGDFPIEKRAGLIAAAAAAGPA